MKLSINQIIDITTGAARVEEEDGMILLKRFTWEQEELYNVTNKDLYNKTFSTAGIKLLFKTNSKRLFIEIENAPIPANRPVDFTGFNLEYPTDEGLEEAKKAIKPVKWDIYGPFFDQLDQPINPNFPSPHAEGCNLPDIVCMVNSEVFLDKEYITDFDKELVACTIDAYEDFIEIDKNMTMGGQMCCYAKAKITSPKAQKVWALVGNSDGFRLLVNGEKVLEADVNRIWTPYNNFTLIDLKEGENEFIVKLLRRTESLKFSLGLRIYDGNHWHRCRWCTDLS